MAPGKTSATSGEALPDSILAAERVVMNLERDSIDS
jgi:hypothetical protein